MIGELLRNRYWTVGVAGLVVLIAGAVLQQLGGESDLALAGTLALLAVAIGLVAGVSGTSDGIRGYLRRRRRGDRMSERDGRASPLA